MKLSSFGAMGVGFLGAFGLLATPSLAKAATSSCAALAKLALSDTQITSARWVNEAAFQIPKAGQGMRFNPAMDPAGRLQVAVNPAFCRVQATIRPSADSDIKIEVWLPRKGWNGKFFAAGNFGWGGSIPYTQMLSGLADGYAVASTDTGHNASGPEGGGGKFSLGHPEKILDYAYRADHEMTVKAKALIKAHYGVDPKYSYWIGCSLGGLEGLIEAKRYPTDYDGIVAGAPPNPLVDFNAAQIWPSWVIAQNPASALSQAKFALVHAAALKTCSTPSGEKDGLIEAPTQCRFDPVELQCSGADRPDCLTAAQVGLMRQIYQGPVNPRTGKVIFPGPAIGSELELSAFAGDHPMSVALDLFRYTAFQDPNWTGKAIDWDKDVTRAEEKVGSLFSVDADLSAFVQHGGRLLLYIGWNDYHNPEQLISYYNEVVQKSVDPARQHNFKLFTIPGMNHCGGGAGCDVFNKLEIIDGWVAAKRLPQKILTSRIIEGKVVRTRPTCAYPSIASYNGVGDLEDAASFSCSTPSAPKS